MHRSRSSSTLIAMSRSFSARRKYSFSTSSHKDAGSPAGRGESSGLVLVGSTVPVLDADSSGTKLAVMGSEEGTTGKESRVKANNGDGVDNIDVIVGTNVHTGFF